MKRHLYYLALMLLFCISITSVNASNHLIINIFSKNNGKGLEADKQILKSALEELGHIVFEKDTGEAKPDNEKSVDINIYFESINENWLHNARLHWLVPNPEWYKQPLSLLDKIDLIVCRTQESVRIFKSLNKETFFLGFTSHDCFRENIKKNMTDCLHMPGSGINKGTSAVLNAWKGNMLMPHLTVVVHKDIKKLNKSNVTWIPRRLPVEDLRALQNQCGIHVCPSVVEGYGHYIMEAMSTGAIVITTDGPPMNELINDERCLISYMYSKPNFLGTNYYANPKHLQRVIFNIWTLPLEERIKIGNANRLIYLEKTKEFKENLKNLMETVSKI